MLSLLPSRPVVGTLVATAGSGAAAHPAGANNVAKLVLKAKAPVVKAHRSG